MKTKTTIRSIVTVAFLLLMAGNGYAYTWNDMVQWFKRYGYKELPQMGHPNDDVVSVNIVSTTSNSIAVKYVYEDCVPLLNVGRYTCRYEIVQGMYGGRPYFNYVKVLEEGYPIKPSFTWWSANLITNYDYARFRRSTMTKWYNRDDLMDLSVGEQAAVFLTWKFMDYVEER